MDGWQEARPTAAAMAGRRRALTKVGGDAYKMARAFSKKSRRRFLSRTLS